MVGRRQFLIATGSAIGGGIALPQAAWSAWRTADMPAALPLPATTVPGGNPLDVAKDEGEAVSPDAPDISESPASGAPRTLLIFDPAFPLACTVAAHARHSGRVALPLEGDAGTFWYRSILPHLQQDAQALDRDGVSAEHHNRGASEHHNGDTFEHRVAITGLTPHAAFFVLSTLATGAGMHTSSRRLASDRHLVTWHLEFRTTT
jgi:hypothetical protein